MSAVLRLANFIFHKPLISKDSSRLKICAYCQPAYIEAGPCSLL